MNEPDNKRRFPRAHVDIELGPTPNRPAGVNERIADISLGGALVVSNDPLPPGSEVHLNFKIPGRKDVLSVRAVVLRELAFEKSAAMAVRFDTMPLQDQITLGTYVSDRAWDQQLPEAEIHEDEEDLPEAESLGAAESPDAGDTSDPRHEWAQEGFVIVRNNGTEVDNDALKEELGGEFIVVDTKR